MLENLKSKVLQIAISADKNGLCKHRSGNFSIRDKETGYIVITPSGIAREDLTIEDICVVDINGNIIEINDKVKPTSEILMHLQAYKTRSDVHAIVHTHSKFATSFSILKKEIPPIVYEAIGYGVTVPVANYGRPGTKELAESITEHIKKSDACLLEAHGVITVDKESIDEALLKAFYVEEVAEIYYRTLVINGGKEPPILPLDEFKLWKYPDAIKVKSK